MHMTWPGNVMLVMLHEFVTCRGMLPIGACYIEGHVTYGGKHNDAMSWYFRVT